MKKNAPKHSNTGKTETQIKTENQTLNIQKVI